MNQHGLESLYMKIINMVRQTCHVNDALPQRLKYYKVFTGTDMYNACSYDLTINTSKLGLKKSEALIMEYLKEIFGDDLLKSK